MSHSKFLLELEEEDHHDYFPASPSPLSRLRYQSRAPRVSYGAGKHKEVDGHLAETGGSEDTELDEGLLTPPPPLSESSSVISSIGNSQTRRSLVSVQNDQVGTWTSSSRLALARRLGQLAEQLAVGEEGDDVDEAGLGDKISRLEQALSGTSAYSQSPPPLPQPYPNISRSQSELLRRPTAPPASRLPSHLASRHRPLGKSMSVDLRAPKDRLGSLHALSASSPMLPTRFSDLSSMFPRERTPEPEPETKAEKRGMSVEQADKIIAEMNTLNEELTTVVANLRARQEESNHIHSLLIERAERAAQRILFLQSRISYLEEELTDNDDDLQHLRISLKAIEVQLPPHPDKELQLCIRAFKEDYQALRRKRANRSSISSVMTTPGEDVVSSASPARIEEGTPRRDQRGGRGEMRALPVAVTPPSIKRNRGERRRMTYE